jgi:hypothetical protein
MHRWDPSTPGFVLSVLRATVLLWLCESLITLFSYRSAFWGVLSGGFIALAALLIIIRAGRQLSPTAHYAPIMIGLFCLHLLIWVLMAVLLAFVKVHPLGFLLGASALPAAIVGTLAWYLLQGKRTAS